MKIKQFLAYSQNFLHSKELVNKLIKKSNLNIEDVVIDIGAGSGSLTFELSKSVKKVISIEMDNALSNNLKRKSNGISNIIVISKNFLNFELPTYNYKVFANIPFNYTSRIINKLFLSDDNSPSTAYLTMQYEAYLKFSGEKRETLISLILKPLFSFEKIYEFNKNDFMPIPAVNVVFIKILKRYDSLIKNYIEYRDFITYSTIRGKPSIKQSLKDIFTYTQLLTLSKNLKFNLKNKPLDLTFEQWIGIYNFYVSVDFKFKRLEVKDQIENSYGKLLKSQKYLEKRYKTNKRK